MEVEEEDEWEQLLNMGKTVQLSLIQKNPLDKDFVKFLRRKFTKYMEFVAGIPINKRNKKHMEILHNDIIEFLKTNDTSIAYEIIKRIYYCFIEVWTDLSYKENDMDVSISQYGDPDFNVHTKEEANDELLSMNMLKALKKV